MTRRIQTFFAILFLFTSALSAERIYFFLKYRGAFSGASGSEVGLAFLKGIQCDLSTGSLVSGIFLILLFLPGLTKYRWYARTILGLLAAWYCALLILNFADIQYFAFVQRHMAMELLDVWHDPVALLMTGVRSYFVDIAGLLIFLGFFIFVFFRTTGAQMSGHAHERRAYPASAALLREMLSLILIVVVLIALITGGYKKKPLSVASMFTSDKQEMGVLSLNGIMTSFQAMFNLKKEDAASMAYIRSLTLPAAGYDELVRAVLTRGGESSDREYPVFRRYTYDPEERRPLNVVVIIMESWSAKFTGALGARPSATPFFDTLAKKGLLLPAFFANGERSTEGLCDIVGSMPAWGVISFRNSGLLAQARSETAATILKGLGYETIFFHGAKLNSLGFDRMMRRMGVDRHISEDDFSDKVEKGTWGVHDGPVFLRANEELRKMTKPFFAVIFSLSSHAPYDVPSGGFDRVASQTEAAGFINAVRYSDYALKRFLEEAAKEPYFKNTIFVITGDHTEGSLTKDNPYEAHRIPCLFYCPKYVAPAVMDGVASQIDIVPTLLDIMKVSEPFTSLGKTVFERQGRRAFFTFRNMYGWVDGPYMLISDLHVPVGLYNYSVAPSQNLLAGRDRGADEIAGGMLNDLRNYVKFEYDMVMENRLRPPARPEGRQAAAR